MAAKHRDKLAANEKRKAGDLTEEKPPLAKSVEAEPALIDDATVQEPPTKKPKHTHSPDPKNNEAIVADDDDNKNNNNDDDDEDLTHTILRTRSEAFQLWIQQLQNSTDRIYQDLYGEHWEVGKEIEAEKLAKLQAEQRRERGELEKSLRERERRVEVDLRGRGWFADDRDPRY